MKLDVTMLIQNLSGTNAYGTDGRSYLAEHLLRPLADGEHPGLLDLDFQAFQIEDIESMYEKWMFYFDFERSKFGKIFRSILSLPPYPQKSKTFF